jgi:hypothetical protein
MADLKARSILVPVRRRPKVAGGGAESSGLVRPGAADDGFEGVLRRR